MSQCREIRIKSVHNMYYGRFYHFFPMKIPQKSRYTNGFYMNGTGSTRDQMRHIIYININKGNGEPSIYMLSPLPFHPLTLTISLPFPLTFPHHIPNIPFHSFPFSPFPHFLLSLNPFPIFPTLAAHSVYPLSHSFLLSPSILQSRTIHIYRPYTLCHTFSHIHPYLPLYPRCTLSYPYSHVLLLSHQSHIHAYST